MTTPFSESHQQRVEEGWRAELAGGLTTITVFVVALAHLLGGGRWLLLDVVATAFLVPLVLIDLRERRLPDRLTLGGFAALLALVGAQGAISGDFGAARRRAGRSRGDRRRAAGAAPGQPASGWGSGT